VWRDLRPPLQLAHGEVKVCVARDKALLAGNAPLGDFGAQHVFCLSNAELLRIRTQENLSGTAFGARVALATGRRQECARLCRGHGLQQSSPRAWHGRS
jgi:hypothetical protein